MKKQQPSLSQSPDVIVERRLTAFRKTIPGMEEAWVKAGSPFGRNLTDWSSFWLKHNYFPTRHPLSPAPAPRTTPYPPEQFADNLNVLVENGVPQLIAVTENNNMIAISIDLRLIDAAKVKHMIRKNGAEASFLNLVLIETPGGQYGEYMVKQESSAEERAAKTQTPILGNGKNIIRKS